MNKLCCPHCGNRELQITTENSTQTSGKNYSAGQGCLGFLLFGPLGLLCGLCGQGKTTTTTATNYWICSSCGHRFKNPEDLRSSINSLHKGALAACSIIGLFFALFLFFLFITVEAPFEAIIFFPLIVFAFFFVVGLLLNKINEGQREKLETELEDIENGMERFQNQVVENKIEVQNNNTPPVCIPDVVENPKEDIAEFEVDQSNIQNVIPIPISDTEVMCPICKMKQPIGRSRCFRCARTFISNE